MSHARGSSAILGGKEKKFFLFFSRARYFFDDDCEKKKTNRMGVRDSPLTFVADVLHERFDTHGYVVLKVVKECWRVCESRWTVGEVACFCFLRV